MSNPICDLCGGGHPTEAHQAELGQESQEAVEVSAHAQSGIDYLKDLVDSSDFRADFVLAAQKEPQETIEKAHKQIQAEIQQKLKAKRNTAEQLAFDEVKDAHADIAAAKKALKKEWGDLVNKVQSEMEANNSPITIDGQEYPYNEAEALVTELVKNAHQEEIAKLEADLSQAASRAESELDALQSELPERQNDPAFLHALELWGRSPDSKGERGEDGQGFHAGIAHFFEYRRGKSKLGRFNETPTIENFIEFSQNLEKILKDPNPETNPQVKDAVYITDDEGRARLMCQLDGWMVSAFQRPGEPLRVITAVAPYKENQFKKDVERELNPEKMIKLNELGAKREQKDLKEYSY